MDERIQRVLDGELPRGELTTAELAVLAEAESIIGGVLRSVPTRSLPDLGPVVLQRIEAERSPIARTGAVSAWGQRMRKSWTWFWTPRPVSLQLRPVYALALTVLLVLGAGNTLRPEAPAATPAAQVLVQFRLDAPDARAVMLAGDFTRWKPAYTLTRSEPGIWTVVVPLEAGVHDYAFVVDGERWQPDPMAPAVADGFGGLNSRLAVLTPEMRRPL